MTVLDYETSSNTLIAGLTLTPNNRLKIALDTVWSEADAAFLPFDFVVPADYLAANPNQSYDYSLTYLNSDLDVSRLELGVRVDWSINERVLLYGDYRRIDFEDDAPYRGDDTGKVEFVSLGVGWSF